MPIRVVTKEVSYIHELFFTLEHSMSISSPAVPGLTVTCLSFSCRFSRYTGTASGDSCCATRGPGTSRRTMRGPGVSCCVTRGPGASYGACALRPAGAGVPASFGASTGANLRPPTPAPESPPPPTPAQRTAAVPGSAPSGAYTLAPVERTAQVQVKASGPRVA